MRGNYYCTMSKDTVQKFVDLTLALGIGLDAEKKKVIDRIGTDIQNLVNSASVKLDFTAVQPFSIVPLEEAKQYKERVKKRNYASEVLNMYKEALCNSVVKQILEHKDKESVVRLMQLVKEKGESEEESVVESEEESVVESEKEDVEKVEKKLKLEATTTPTTTKKRGRPPGSRNKIKKPEQA